MNTLRILLAVLVVTLGASQGRAASFTAPITGGGTISGSITGAYSFNGPFSVVNATNVYLSAVLSNQVAAPPLGFSTNYNQFLRAYSNVIDVVWSNGALASGLNLTNIASQAAAGTLIRVHKGPGPYWIGTNEVSLLAPGVDMELNGAVITMGTTADSGSPRYIFDDALDGKGARTNRIYGTGEFYITNNQGGLMLQTEGNSETFIQYRIARTLGNQVLHSVDAGSYTVHQLDYGQSDEYDFMTTAFPKKIAVYGGKIFAGDSIFEFANAFTNSGDCVIQVQYGEVLTNGSGSGTAGLTIHDNVIIDGGVWNLYRNGTLSTGQTNGNATGAKAIVQNAVIRSAPDNTKSTVQRVAAAYGTALTIRNSTIEGPTGVDPIDINPMSGIFTLENTRVISGSGATNSVRATTSGSRLRLVGANALDKPLHANVSLTADVTNRMAAVDVSSFMSRGIGYFSNLVNAYAGADLYGDLHIFSPATFIADAGGLMTGGPLYLSTGSGLNIDTVTASRAAVFNADGTLTNVTSSSPSTEYVKADGTTGTPSGSGGGGTNFPNVNLLLGNTNLVLSAGVRKAFHNQTNGSHGINLNLAVPESGYEVTYSVSNSSASDITVTFYTNSVAANPYDIATKTNVNTFTASASAITQADLKYIGSGIWVIENVIGPTTILEFGSGITAVTNGVNGRTISISASGGTTAGPDGSQLISMDGETQWINGEDFFVQESFYSGQSNPWGQTRTTSGGSATFTGNPGYVRLSSWPTNTANYAAFHYGSGAGATVPWQSNLFIEAKLQILNSGDITNSEFSVGFYNAMQTLATTATIRWLGRGDWHPNWIAAVGVGSTYSYATTGLAIAHSTPYTLKIKGTTNTLAFYTNGVLFTNLTSNLPGGVAIQPGARSMATVNTGTVDDNSLDVDWLNIKVR